MMVAICKNMDIYLAQILSHSEHSRRVIFPKYRCFAFVQSHCEIWTLSTFPKEQTKHLFWQFKMFQECLKWSKTWKEKNLEMSESKALNDFIYTWMKKLIWNFKSFMLENSKTVEGPGGFVVSGELEVEMFLNTRFFSGSGSILSGQQLAGRKMKLKVIWISSDSKVKCISRVNSCM